MSGLGSNQERNGPERFVVAGDVRCTATNGRDRCFRDPHGDDVPHRWLHEALEMVRAAAVQDNTSRGSGEA